MDAARPTPLDRDERVRYVECPRDAWQGLTRPIPTGRKREHLSLLFDEGFRQLDLASFVSPRAVPQMADSDRVVAGLAPPPNADLLGVVLNERGLDRALALPELRSVGFPLSVSATFERRNSGRTLEASWDVLERLHARVTASGPRLVVYLSMGFGNPYGDPWSPAATADAAARLAHLGGVAVALADTVGRADRATVAEVLDAVDAPAELGVHLHARPDGWEPLVAAALERGVRWIEGALAGVGGCPFAGDALVGNLPTERVVPWLRAQGFVVDAPADLARSAADAAEIATLYGR